MTDSNIPITENPDVQRLIAQNVVLQVEIKIFQKQFEDIKAQYARDLVATNKYSFPEPVCQNQPPEIVSGMNGCLSCPMRKTCLLIFKEEIKPE